MERSHIDPLYDYIRIDESTFNIINNKSIRDEISRLKKINHLGGIREIYSLSKHSKFEHTLGLYYLVDLLEKEAKSQLNRADLQSKNLKLAAILHGIGHLPYTYATESAICWAYNLDRYDDTIKNQIDKIIKEITNYLDMSRNKKNSLKKFLKTSNYFELHKWFEGKKILENDEIPEGRKEVVLRYIIDKEHAGYKVLMFLDRIDFVMRDAYYINLFNLNINLIPFINNISISKDEGVVAPKETSLLDSYHDILRRKIYFDHKVMALENLLARKIAKLILEEDLTLNNLFQMNDNELIKEVNEFGFEIGYNQYKFNELSRSLKNDDIELIYRDNYSSERKNPIKVEKDIAHKVGKDFLDYYEEEGYFVTADMISPPGNDDFGNLFDSEYPAFIDKYQYQINIFWHTDNEDPKRILRAIKDVENSFSIEERSEKTQLTEFLMGYETEVNYERYEYVKNRIEEYVTSNVEIEKLFDSFTEENKIRFQFLKDMHEKPGIYNEEALSNILKELFLDLIIKSPEKIKAKFLKGLLEYLQTKSPRGSNKAILKEFKGYLNVILNNKNCSNKFWTYPSLNVLEDDGNKLREIDIISIEYRGINTKPKIYLHEISTTDNLSKRNESGDKLGHVRNIIDKRFPNKFRFIIKFNHELLDI